MYEARTMRNKKWCTYNTRTDCGKTRNGKESGQEDHFCRLPEKLFVFILTIVADLKSLFLCSIVSKHFESMVLRVRTICATIPMSEGGYESVIDMQNDPKLKPLVFLEKFKVLEYIYLEYKCQEDIAKSPFSLWKVKFDIDFSKIERFVAFLNVSTHKQTPNESHNKQNNAMLSWSPAYECLGFLTGYGCYADWMYVISMLGKHHNSLKGVTVTDSSKAGKMVVGHEQLVRLRSSSHAQEMFHHPKVAKMITFPVLHLPISGYVLRDVLLVIHNNPTKSSPSDIDDMLFCDFEEDGEQVLGEVVEEIIKNHRDKLKNLRYDQFQCKL